VPPIERLGIVGVGLIGASFALALRAAGAVGRVVGAGRDPGNLERARALGAIDEATHDPAAAARDADFVLVATPVGAMGEVFERIAPVLGRDAVVTDAGSTKAGVIELARAGLRARIPQFVPGHPVAGSDESGAAAGRADLYRGREVIVTPLPENPPALVGRVRAAWHECGARVSEMTPADHDAVLAAVSHLPHLIAYALMGEVARRADAKDLLAHAGTGFRDLTRLAASHPVMWRDICLANRVALLAELRRYQDSLSALGALLEQGDAGGLERAFSEARTLRRAWTAQSAVEE
jgi:prephenate dehydrogenase